MVSHLDTVVGGLGVCGGVEMLVDRVGLNVIFIEGESVEGTGIKILSMPQVVTPICLSCFDATHIYLQTHKEAPVKGIKH